MYMLGFPLPTGPADRSRDFNYGPVNSWTNQLARMSGDFCFSWPTLEKYQSQKIEKNPKLTNSDQVSRSDGILFNLG